MIKIVEKLLLGKNQEQELCEDGIFISDNFVAIIDGVTSKSSQRYEGKTSGRYARDVLLNALEDMPIHYDSNTALKYLNSKLPKTENIFDDRIQAGLILYNDYKKEIWSYGDCICMIDNILHEIKGVIEGEIIGHRIDFLKEEIKNGKIINDLLDNDTGRLHIQDYIKDHWKYANTGHKYGYAVLDGISFNKKLVKIYDVVNSHEIVLASDGYPFLKSTLLGSENAIQELKDNDPLCMDIFKGSKGFYPNKNGFDDRAYVRFVIE